MIRFETTEPWPQQQEQQDE